MLNAVGIRAVIDLYDNDDQTVGRIEFHVQGRHLPTDEVDSRGVIKMHLPEDRLTDVLNILRNEGPLVIAMAEVPPRAQLRTLQRETIGAEDD